jgi:hypothetical protein
MASTIKVKRSAVQGKAPTTGNLDTGELALNTRDGRLYSKGTQVFEVGANNHSLFVGAGGATFANGAYTLPTADGSADQILKTNGSGTLSFADAAAAGGSIIFYEYDGTRDDIALSGTLQNDALANTNAYIATRASEADSLSRLANTNAYIASVSATERSALANTNAYIATKLDSSSYTTADVQSKASLANTNAYIASVSATERSALANTNSYIATKLDSSSYTTADVQSKASLANTNAYIATKVAQSGANNSAKIPYGTTGQRDGSPDTGFFRYNVTTASAEIYDGSAWGEVGGGGGATGGGNDQVFYENGQTITTSYTITTNTNAMSTGPLTVNSGVSVTVPSGSRWVVL